MLIWSPHSENHLSKGSPGWCSCSVWWVLCLRHSLLLESFFIWRNLMILISTSELENLKQKGLATDKLLIIHLNNKMSYFKWNYKYNFLYNILLDTSNPDWSPHFQAPIILSWCGDIICGLIYIFLLINDAEHHFIYLLPIEYLFHKAHLIVSCCGLVIFFNILKRKL